MKRDELTLDLPLAQQAQQVDFQLVARQQTMTKALQLCQTLSGKDDAQFYGPKGIVKDQAQWSRIMGPSSHNFPHDKLNLFMDLAGNEAPLLWMLHARGYDPASLRKMESATERRLRLTEEALAAERNKVQVLTNALNGRTS
ncbi:hypothetical protein [Limnobacter sp.]|uniref:hypothetical protein n=1 Tax=Limnobacter sp. TaxID=2003368 RepID=UPI0027342AA2|nr:hypothetical protein [Limnobacter sp.]MDP3272067.1 hypothetical protein [Limnobacter sp.]